MNFNLTNTIKNKINGFHKAEKKKTLKIKDIVLIPEFEKMLGNTSFTELLNEVVDFGISRFERDYKNTYLDTDFVLYKKYTYIIM